MSTWQSKSLYSPNFVVTAVFIVFCGRSLNDPCGGGGKCRAPFSFINNLPLTGEVQLFVDKVKNETISGNVDFPEGGMDALMQVLVCTDVSLVCCLG